MNDFTVICLTPVRNEAWILEAFLHAAELWADVIIICDQGSDDDSTAIARRHAKVRLVQNRGESYSERDRQRILMEEARKVPGPRILIAVDADEFLSPALASRAWFRQLWAAGAGAGARVPFFNVKPGLQQGWIGNRNYAAGWVDDGGEHDPAIIHAPRLPPPRIVVKAPPDVAAMHFQFVAPERMRSKHRWYQCWERLHRSQRNAVDVYREYHHMDALAPREMLPVPEAWLAWYRRQGVDLAAVRDDGRHWWDRHVLAWMEDRGPAFFRRESIWDVDWRAKARALGLAAPDRFADPRRLREKCAHAWLAATQMRKVSLATRLGDKFWRRILR